MSDGPSATHPFRAAQIRLDDEMDQAHPEPHEEVAANAAGIWTAIEQLRNGDRVEAQHDSMRQFRWNLSFLRAAAGDALPDAFDEPNE